VEPQHVHLHSVLDIIQLTLLSTFAFYNLCSYMRFSNSTKLIRVHYM
jgi:hypothetical protein